MTIEQFKNNWQPQMDGYARFSFNLDLKELVQQTRADAIEEGINDFLFWLWNERKIDKDIWETLDDYYDKWLKEQNNDY